MWCVAELTPEYIDKMEDTLRTYEKPDDPLQPVVCLDEKPISLHDALRPPIPAKPGKPAKQDNEYERCGTANVFGVVAPRPHPTAPAPSSRASWGTWWSSTRRHKPDYFGEQKGGDLWDRLTVHYTPKHGSWLNQAEIELNLYSRQCLGKRRIPDLGKLKRETKAWTVGPTRSGRRSTGASRGRRPARCSSTNRPAHRR